MDINKSQLLAVAIAGGATVREAAESCNVSESAAYRHCRTHEFHLLTSRIRGEMIERSISMLSSACIEAVQTLMKCMGGSDEKVQLAAAKAVLTTLIPMSEHLELRRRIEELEQQTLAASRKFTDESAGD